MVEKLQVIREYEKPEAKTAEKAETKISKTTKKSTTKAKK